MRHTLLINYALYQIGWFACVLGGAWHRPWTGFLIAALMIGVHLALSVERALEARLIVLAIGVGAMVEMFQIASGTYHFTSGTIINAVPPLWLLAMWAQFATTFRFSLRSVIARPASAAVFGAIGGPIAFLAGERLGAVILLPPFSLGLLRLSISWAVAVVLFSAVMRRVSPNPDAPRYRSRLAPRITFVASSSIPASAEAVFDWHEAPGAFERLTPPWERVRVLSHEGGIRDGARVSLLVGPRPVSLRWDLQHQEYQHGRSFTDVQISGPFRYWKHDHRMMPQGEDSCVLEDTIEYQLPFGAIGRLCGRWLVQRKLTRLFRYRHAVTRRAFEGPPR